MTLTVLPETKDRRSPAGRPIRIVCGDEHRWRDSSEAGPDSGTADLECERCGFVAPTILY